MTCRCCKVVTAALRCNKKVATGCIFRLVIKIPICEKTCNLRFRLECPVLSTSPSDPFRLAQTMTLQSCPGRQRRLFASPTSNVGQPMKISLSRVERRALAAKLAKKQGKSGSSARRSTTCKPAQAKINEAPGTYVAVIPGNRAPQISVAKAATEKTPSKPVEVKPGAPEHKERRDITGMKGGLNSIGEFDARKELSKNEYLDPETELELTRRYRDTKCEVSLHRLIRAHMRLSASVAKSMKRSGVSLNDLIQEGNIGLMKAAEKYDPESGNKFATYAVWWVKAAIQEAVMRDNSAVRLKSSSSNRTCFFNMSKMEANAERSLRAKGIDPTIDLVEIEIARSLNISLERLKDIKATIPAASSLNESVRAEDEEGRERLDFLPDGSPSTEEIVVQETSQAHVGNMIAGAMKTLNEREKQVVLERTMSLEPKTLDALSSVFGVTRERVRQIEASAKKKIKAYLERNGVNTVGILVDQ